MANQYVNKVVVNNEIKMDLTEDTITPNTLRKGFTAHDASGAPIVGNESLTDISDGTTAGPILKLTAEGWAEQDTLSGKNLLPNTASGTQTINGVTFTVNPDKSITCTGTATADTYFELAPVNTVLGYLASDTTYLMSGVTNGSASTYQLLMRTASTDKQDVTTGGNETKTSASTSFRSTGNKVINRVAIIVYSGATVDTTIYPQLELGNTATDYEPYCGAAPSPSPDYPQEIRVARGRNLLNPLAAFDNASLYTVNADNSVTVKAADSRTWGSTMTMFPLPVGTYTLSCESGNDGRVAVQYDVDDQAGTAAGPMLFDGNGQTTFTITKSNSGVKVKLYNGTFPRTVRLQLEKDSVATPYVPYGHVGMEYPRDLMKLDYLSDGYITSSSGVATISALTQGGAHTWIVDLGESRNSSVLVQVGGDRCRVAEFDSYPKVGLIGKTITYSDVTWYSDTPAEHIVTFVPTKRYLAFFCAAVASNAVEPHPPVSLKLVQTIPIPLPSKGFAAALPDGTSDILTLDGAGGYEWKLMSKEGVLDGSVACDYMSSTSTTTRARIPAFSDRVMQGSVNFFMNKFRRAQSLTGVWPSLAVNEAYLDSAGFVIGLPLNTFSTTADVTTWLASNPVTVLYPLATPQTESGYVQEWNNDFPLGCTIDIPELRNINAEYFLYDSITQLADDYYDRTTNDISEAMSQTADSATLEALAAIAPIENDISSANYPVGSYLIHDGKLCQVTQAIAANEAITVGTNVVLTNVSNELDELNDAVDEINANPYILPTMSESEKGGAKVGEGLSVSDDVLNVDMFSTDPNDAGPLLSLQAEGWAEQTQLSGKNLIPNGLSLLKTLNTSGTWNGNAYTINGVVFTVNNDGSITLNGQRANSDSAALSFVTYSNPISLAAGTYTLSGCPAGGSDSTYRLDLYDVTGSEATLSRMDYGNGNTFTISEAKTIHRCLILPYPNATLNNLVFYPQLELGSQVTSYEPYCGGVSSPNPDYPQEIKVARGRNLLPNTTMNKTINGVTFVSQSDGSISVSGMASENANAEICSLELSAGTYTLSGCPSGGSSTTYRAYLMGTELPSSKYDEGNGNTFIIDDAVTVKYRIIIYSGQTVNLTFKPQLEAGSVPTLYVPYGHVGVNVHGPNLWHQTTVADGESVISNGITMTACDNGSGFVASGTATAQASYPSALSSTDAKSYSLLSAGTYTASSNTTYRVRKLVDGTVTEIKTATTGDWSFTIDEDTLIRIIPIIPSGTVFSTPTHIWAQINLGDSAFDYQPYHSTTIPVPLPEKGWAGSLPDGTTDILKLDGAGGYEWVNNTNEVVLDGSSDEVWASTGGGYAVRTMMFENLMRRPANNGATAVMLASHFGVPSWNAVAGGTVGIAFSAGGTFGYTRTGEATTVTAETTWLSQNPVKVLYPLATPQTEQGYIPDWDNCIPIHATIDIPELRNLGVECYLNEESARINAQWSKRLKAADDISASNATTESLASLAPVEGDISSANYTVGSYLIHNNQLCKVTVAIATNETIAEGSNITPVTLSDDVKYLIDNPYILPTMSESTKGGAKIGYGLNVENDILSVGGVDDLNDAGPIVKLNANGWAEQFSTTGKNLYPNTATTQTIDGVTFTVNADKSITCNGTATASAVYEIATPNTALAIVPAGTYILSGIMGGSQSTYKLDIRFSYDTSNITGGDWSAAVDGGKTVTFTDTCVINRARIVIYSGTTINTTIYPQLELGSTATSYEPYTGAAPSPSPSYPQEIKVCRGKNLLDRSNVTESAYISDTGVVTSNPNMFYSSRIPVAAGETYTLSGESGMSTRVFVSCYGADGNWLSSIVYTGAVSVGDAYSQTFTIPSDAKSIVVSRSINDPWIQLERGSVLTSYVPYGHIGMDVAYPWTVYKDNYYYANNNSAVESSLDSMVIRTSTCNEGRHMFLVTGTTGLVSSTTARVNAFDKSGRWLGFCGRVAVTVGETKSFAFDAPVGTAEIRASANKNTTFNLTTTIPIPLPERGYVASLPDGTADTLTLDGAGGYEWEMATNQITLNGSESWGTGNSGKLVILVESATADMRKQSASSETFVCYCSHFRATTPSATWAGTLGVSGQQNKTELHFADGTGAMTVADFTTWLSSNPVTVLYPLATPQVESGYIDYDNTIPVHATISSADLEGIEIRCVADSGAAEISAAWGKRIENELNSLREIVNTLLANS